MKRILHPSLTLGARQPMLSKRESTLARLDMVLHSRVGDIPWRPEFGCDVTGLIGEPATPSNSTNDSVGGANDSRMAAGRNGE